MSRGYVAVEREVESRPESGTAQARVTIDRSCGCERLEQRVLRFAPGRSEERETGKRQEVLYVASGRGTLHVADEPHDGRCYRRARTASSASWSTRTPAASTSRSSSA